MSLRLQQDSDMSDMIQLYLQNPHSSVQDESDQLPFSFQVNYCLGLLPNPINLENHEKSSRA